MVPGFAVPPAEPLYHAPFMTTTQCSWIGGTADWKGDVPHPAPYRFLLVNILGEFQVTAGDGSVRDMVPGSVMLVEDTWGTGHSTRSTSGDEGLCLFFAFPDFDRIGADMKPTGRPNDEAAAANITERIQALGDWRGETLAQVRRLIHDAVPDIQEEWKWRGVPVWSHDGIVCTGESYKQVVKLTFARGATIEDPKQLFNSSLDGNTRRAIDLREGEEDRRSCLQATDPRRGGGQRRNARSTGSQEVSVALSLRGAKRRAISIVSGIPRWRLLRRFAPRNDRNSNGGQ